MKHRDVQDIAGGVLMSALGLFFVYFSRKLEFGTGAAMGPGYFPTVLGWVLALLGVLIAAPALRRHGEPVVIRWKNLVFVLGSVVLFALTLKPLGLIGATLLSALLASVADNEITWRTRILMAVGLAIITALVFVGGLGMILPLTPFDQSLSALFGKGA